MSMKEAKTDACVLHDFCCLDNHSNFKWKMHLEFVTDQVYKIDLSSPLKICEKNIFNSDATLF